MIWVDALEAVTDLLADDAELVEALEGPAIFRNGEHNEYRVPGLYWLVVSDIIEENTNPFRVQWDIYARDFDQALAIERRMRLLLHRDVPQTIGEIKMWTQLEDAQDIPYPTNEAVHRSMDWRFEPAREAVPY